MALSTAQTEGLCQSLACSMNILPFQDLNNGQGLHQILTFYTAALACRVWDEQRQSCLQRMGTTW